MSTGSFMNGVPELLLLKALDRQEMYGYELVEAIRLQTADAIRLGEGVVYPVLHALEKAGALKSRRKDINGRTRIYYSVTAKGRKRLDGLINDWRRIASAVGGLISEETHAAAPLRSA